MDTPTGKGDIAMCGLGEEPVPHESHGTPRQEARTVTPMNDEVIVTHAVSGDASSQRQVSFSEFDSEINMPSLVNEQPGSIHNYPTTDDLPVGNSVDLLDAWFFQREMDLLMTPLPDLLPEPILPSWNNSVQFEKFSTEPILPEDTTETLQPSNRFVNLISTERFGKIQNQWQARSSRAIRLVPTLWYDLAASERKNVFCKQLVSEPLKSDVRQKGVSRWGFDDECRQQMQLTLDSLTQAGSIYSPQSAEMDHPDNLSRSGTGSSPTYNLREIILPSTETCEVALEIYFHQFHPTLPVIHLPTFSVKGAPFPMLFVLCLLGFSILGTPSVTKLVSEAFPVCFLRLSNAS
jgi:hypothetical protein